MPDLFFLQSDPQTAFLTWLRRLDEACDSMESLPETATETYVRAMRVCAADRMLTLEFYDAWRANSSLQNVAQEIHDLVFRGLQLLRNAEEKNIVLDQGEVRRGSHLREMIQNTEARLGVLETICRDGVSRTDRCNEVEKRYRDFGQLARGRAA